MNNHLSSLQEKILRIIQDKFPVQSHPFQNIAQQVGSSEQEIILELDQLKKNGVIRRIGAFFDARRLGYVSTLVAAQVPQYQLEPFVNEVNALPGVSHNYGRDHSLNVWFTLTAESMEHIEKVLDSLKRKSNLKTLYNLPAVRMFKLNVRFSADSASCAETRVGNTDTPVEVLTEQQKHMIRLLQQDILLEAKPFSVIAETIGQSEDDVLNQINDWINRDVVRRFGAAVRHHHLGFTCNCLAVFNVSSEQIEPTGKLLSQSPHVSHCYQRRTYPDWPYNIYAMTHCQNEHQMKSITENLIRQIQPSHYELLPTLVEYKKSTVHLFTPP